MLLLTNNAFQWGGGQQKAMVIRETCPQWTSGGDWRHAELGMTAFVAGAPCPSAPCMSHPLSFCLPVFRFLSCCAMPSLRRAYKLVDSAAVQKLPNRQGGLLGMKTAAPRTVVLQDGTSIVVYLVEKIDVRQRPPFGQGDVLYAYIPHPFALNNLYLSATSIRLLRAPPACALFQFQRLPLCLFWD